MAVFISLMLFRYSCVSKESDSSSIMDKVWGFEFERENRTLDVHIRTLRAKLGEAGNCIETVRGVGYKIGGGV